MALHNKITEFLFVCFTFLAVVGDGRNWAGVGRGGSLEPKEKIRDGTKGGCLQGTGTLIKSKLNF